MPDQITGLLEIQTDDQVTTITLDGNTADVAVGVNEMNGLVVQSWRR